jgi:hypothetical protein
LKENKKLLLNNYVKVILLNSKIFSLGFDDITDYTYLKRIFIDLFVRQGFEDDKIFDWDILRKKKEQDTVEGGTGDISNMKDPHG